MNRLKNIALGNQAPLWMEVQARKVWQGQRELKLTRLEFDVLECTARRAGQVIPYAELWACVWKGNGTYGAAERAVVREVLKRLRRKLQEDALIAENLTIVRGVGVRLEREGVQIIE